MDLTPEAERPIAEQVYLDAARVDLATYFANHAAPVEWWEKQIESVAKRADFRAAVESAYRAGREDAAKAVPAAQAAAVRGAGDGIREAMRQTSVLLSGPQIAQLLDGIAREIERGEPTNLGRSEPRDSQHTQDGGE